MGRFLTILAFVFCSLSTLSQPLTDLVQQDVRINIYPNPADDYIMVDVGKSYKKTTFELNSMIGNKVIVDPEDLGGGKLRISLKNLTTGYYFLIIKDREKKSRVALRFLKN